MAIAPLQLPGPLVVPQLDFTPLNAIGDAYLKHAEREREKSEFAKVVDTFGGGPDTPAATPRAPGTVPPGTAPPTVPRGLRNNNFGNIKDGPFAKTQPGYTGADPEGHAIFETPEHGAQAMHALLEAYGRKGTKTIRDVVSRWAPASDGNDPDAYAKFVANGGDPDAPIDLADHATRGAIAKRMSMFENGIGSAKGALLADRAAAGAPREGDFSRVAQAAPQQSNVTRGLQLNNPGNIPDGAMAKALPGYKGGKDGLAVFDSPDNGLGAMDAMLVSYGRRGLKTARDVVSRWTSDPNQVERYATYVGNGNPDATLDLSSADQRREVVQRLARAENGGATAGRQITPDMAAKMKALFNVGTPAAQQAAYALLSKFVGKQDPIKLSEGDVLLDPNDPSKVVGRAPGKSQTVRAGGAIVQDGKVVYQAPPADAGEKIKQLIAEREAVAKERNLDLNDPVVRQWTLTGTWSDKPDKSQTLKQTADERRAQVKEMGLDEKEPEVQKYVLTGQLDIKPGKGESLEDLVASRERIAKKLNMDPTSVATQAFIATGKHPGDEKVTSTALKMIGEAEDENVNLNELVTQLDHAKELNPKIYTGLGSGVRTFLGTKLTDKAVPDFVASPDQAQATEQWLSVMEPGALETMSKTLKGATTDFELRKFTKLLADPTTTEKTRGEIIDKMLRMARGKLTVNQARMDELRGGTYTKAGGGQSAPRAQPKTPPQFGTPEFEKLPPGEQYTAPDGSVRTKR